MSMFCFQCEQTAGCAGCTGAQGVCGKTAAAAQLQDDLTGALISLARAASGAAPTPAPATDQAMIEGLFTTLTNVNFDEASIQRQMERVRREKEALAPGCSLCAAPCGRTAEYDLSQLWCEQEDLRSLKSLLLFGLRGMAAYAYHARALGYTDEQVNRFFYKGMLSLGEPLEQDQLLSLLMECGQVNLRCMELLDQANTQTYGSPTPTPVSMQVEKGPFIVVSGHDLKDLEQLLQQTAGKGIHIYTHGEMLPAHAYPKLKAYPHLKGNFGTAWQNQQREFDGLPAPILFTTNCLMPPKPSYQDRAFTTAVVDYPGLRHIGPDKDFGPVIEKALALGGFEQDTLFAGINGGSQLTTGFGHDAVLSVADQVVQAVRSGAVRHIFLVGGCDGARPGRNYYTEFVKQAPPDTLILTLACGKYRFNDLDLGSIDGLPRLMDMGQCNDAYSAIRVALALAEAFGCSVNDLPLTLVLSWYEQKAVCILLSLLSLGLQNIYLGPTLPAFVSPHVLDHLAEQFHLSPIHTPEEDLARILGGKQ